MTPLQRWLLRRAQRIPSRALAMHHAELVAGVSGRVVEIGAGTGNLFARYPATVTELLAIEPDPGSCCAAASTSADLSFPVTVFNGGAEQLPVETGTADVVVCSEMLLLSRRADQRSRRDQAGASPSRW